MTRINEFVDYLESKVGNIYIWGAQGQRVDAMKDPEGWIRKCEIDNGESYVRRALALYAKVKASGKKPIEAYDCSGLITHFLYDMKHWLPGDKNAQGLYAMCENKAKGTANLATGDLVFIHNSGKGKMTHVGVYVGDGCTIESYGRDLGVVKRRLTDGRWTHSGRLALLYKDVEDDADAWTVKRVLKLDTPMQRGEDVRELQRRLLNLGFIRAIAGGNTAELKADGVYGEITEAAVKLFQRARKLTVDGKAGERTITALGGVWDA